MDRRIVNDEQLTAYALGELEGADWAAAEERVAGDEAARRYVEDVRAAAQLMSEGLSAQPSPGLDESNREAIDEHLERRSRSHFGPGQRKMLVAQPILIAFVAIAVFAFMYLLWRPNLIRPSIPTSQPVIKGHIPVATEHELPAPATQP